MQLEIAILTRQGARAYNEDRLAQWTDGRYAICVVADGAGGHGGGDVAATLACDSIVDAFAAAPSLQGEDLRKFVLAANDLIFGRQADGGRLANMRSTLVLAAIDLEHGRMVWAHCGDSRAYLFRGHAVVARTTDHSLVQQMVASGMLGDEEARRHPQRNVLISALGAPASDVDVQVSDPMRLEFGDGLLLCSDGIWEPLGDEFLMTALSHAGSPAQWVNRIEEGVFKAAKPDQDNYTAMALWVSLDAEQPTILVDP